MTPLFLAWLVCGASAHHSAPKQAPHDEEPAPVHLPAPPPLPKGYRAVAVLPIQSFEVPEVLVESIEHAVGDEIDETPNTQAISRTDAMVDLNKLGLNPADCGRDATCLAQAGLYTRAHAVMDVYVTSLGGEFTISMRLLDSTNGNELGRVAEPLPEEEQARFLLIHRMVVQLLAPETYVGDLTVQVAQDGAEIYLDDTLLGLSPMAKPASYRAGVHILRVSKEGYTDVNRFVEIAMNRATTLTVDLSATTVNVGVDMIATKEESGALFVVTDEPGFEIRVDGEPVGVTPLAGALAHLPPGQRTLSLRKPGRPVVTQTVNIVTGKRSDFALTSEPDGVLKVQLMKMSPMDAPLPTKEDALPFTTPAPKTVTTVAEAPITESSWRTPAGIAAGSAGFVAVVVGIFYGNDARQFNNEAAGIINQINSGQVTTVDERVKLENRLQSLNSKGPQATKVEEGTLIGGAGLLAIGGALVLWDYFRQTPSAETTVTTTPAPTPQTQWQVLPWGGLEARGFSLGARF